MGSKRKLFLTSGVSRSILNFLCFIGLGMLLFLPAGPVHGAPVRKTKTPSSFYNRSSHNSSSPFLTNRNRSDVPASPVLPQTPEFRPLTAQERIRVENCRRSIHQDNVDLLIKANGEPFDANLRSATGETLIQYAVRERRMKCVNFLLERKANVNWQDRLGLYPLFLCTKDTDVKLASILIDAGAVTSLQEKTSQWTVFHKAAAENNTLVALAVLMREKSGLNVHDREGRTPLHLAVTRDPRANVEIVEFLLKNKAEVNALDAKGRTPLDLTKQKDIVRCLLRYGARHGSRKGRHF